MFFDATGHHGRQRRDAVEKLFRCCVPTEDSLAKKKAVAPAGRAALGRGHQLPGVRHLRAAPSTRSSPREGTPIRATCSVSMEEMPGEPAKQNPTSGGLSLPPVRTVVAGDSLASIAYAEYGDPTLWRPLAAFNGIDDPLRLRLGSHAAAAHRRRPHGRGVTWPGADQQRVHDLEIDGTALPADVEPLLVSADVDDSLNLPDLFDPAVPRRRAHRARQDEPQDRREARDRGDQQGVDVAGTTDHRRGHRAGGRVRRDRDVHRRPRLRPRAPALPRPPHRDLHAESPRRTSPRRSRSAPG